MTSALSRALAGAEVEILADPEIERLCQGLALASGFALSIVVTESRALTRVLPELAAKRATEIGAAPLRPASLTLSHRSDPNESQPACLAAW